MINEIEGRVLLGLVVDKDGNVHDPEVVESDPKEAFDDSALQAVLQYRFEPAMKDGEAVNVRGKLPIRYRLGSE